MQRLLLARENRYETESLEKPDLDDEGRGFLTVCPYPHLSIVPDVCDLLVDLDEACVQFDQDMVTLVGEQEGVDLSEARSMLARLSDLGLALGHPALSPPNDIGDDLLPPEIYNDWMSDPTRLLGDYAREGRATSAPLATQWGWRTPATQGMTLFQLNRFCGRTRGYSPLGLRSE